MKSVNGRLGAVSVLMSFSEVGMKFSSEIFSLVSSGCNKTSKIIGRLVETRSGRETVLESLLYLEL